MITLLEKLSEIIKTIKSAANDAGMNPGVYKMINSKGTIIYVGKAKHLKNRLISYSRFEQLPNRTKMMVSNIHKIEFIVVNSELEALLLESNLIKQFKPFYNVLLKDDKTFPYIVLDMNHDFPRVFKYRTLKPKGKNFFGPYPSIASLDETIKIIQKAFLLRNCTDNYFSQRQRPCLQYFIKRCSAPCVNKISKESYAENVSLAKDLLLGKDETARKQLINQMNEAAEKLDFENAASLRDRIKAVSEIQSKQYIQIDDLNSKDFLAIAKDLDNVVIAITFFRAGRNVGTETFILNNSAEMDDIDIIESFILQFYKDTTPPSEVITDCELKNKVTLSEFFKLNEANVRFSIAKQGVYKRILDSCLTNAKMRLKRENHNQYTSQIDELKKILNLSKIDRIETYDNSHLQGTNACGIMVVFENGALQKNKSRKFNIDSKTANGGDDFEMMKFSLEKRFKSKHIPEIPDLLIIDGGKSQVTAAMEIRDKFNLRDKVTIIGIAKQNDRKIGDEKLVFEDGTEKLLGRDSSLLSFLIMLRNEAHRTAITFHRKKRQKTLIKSALDDVPFIGKTRKKLLLEYFGSLDFIKNASIDALKMVKGIDRKTAESIYNYFREKK